MLNIVNIVEYNNIKLFVDDKQWLYGSRICNARTLLGQVRRI